MRYRYAKANYVEMRKSRDSIFGYGLSRRFAMISALFEELCAGHSKVHLVDFGCADGEMLSRLLNRFDSQIESALGIDIFQGAMPESTDPRLRFQHVQLSREFPYPIETESQHFLIGSAFYKHSPNPLPFLVECHRSLYRGGHLVLLDPCPWVIGLGKLLGHFEARYNPNPWNRAVLRRHLDAAGLSGSMELADYHRYWVAPTRRFYELGVEAWIPGSVIRTIGLHQAAVVRKCQ